MELQKEDILIIDGEDTPVEETSAHRAFLYSMAMPGWGEKYAGALRRASITGMLLTFCIFLLFYSFFDFFAGVANVLTSVAKGISANKLTQRASSVQSSVVVLLIAIVGIYFVWLWGIISSVEMSRAKRIADGGKAQKHPIWPLVMSYFCPGSGHIYMGDNSWGYCLFALAILGILLIVPSGLEFMEHVQALGAKGMGPKAMLLEARNLQALLTFGIGTLIGLAIQGLAIAETAALVHKHFDSHFPHKRPLRWFTQVLINYFCPGAGHIISGRVLFGFKVVYAYIGSHLLIGLLLGMEFISPAQANDFAWLPTLLRWAAVVEAPLHEILSKETNSASE